jgi:glycosyltransferase involved in cell wall biosynthesis
LRVIIFTWEYPPRIVGQLAEYTSNLSTQLVKKNVETYLVTYHPYLTGLAEESNGVKIARVANPVRTHIGVLTWVLTLNQEVERNAANIYYQTGRQIDVIDVYDWHFVPAAATLKKALGIPFVYSVDSLEDHRSPGANSPFNMAIKSIEWLGFYEAAAVTTKSEWMRDEIIKVYKVPKEKIHVVLPSSSSWIDDVLKVYAQVSGGARKP